jgi:Uma2 family endonuclease
MAIAPVAPLVSVDEYLNTSYHPDVEYVDGVLVEKGMPTVAHNLLEQVLLFWFAPFAQQFRFKAMHEIRTVIIERSRYRLPDVLIIPKPLRNRICDVVPWVVIEIVSPDDTIKKTRARFLDYSNLGVKHVLQLDPEEYVAHRFDHGSLIETRFESLELPTGTVPFNSEELFRRLRAELEDLGLE